LRQQPNPPGANKRSLLHNHFGLLVRQNGKYVPALEGVVASVDERRGARWRGKLRRGEVFTFGCSYFLPSSTVFTIAQSRVYILLELMRPTTFSKILFNSTKSTTKKNHNFNQKEGPSHTI